MAKTGPKRTKIQQQLDQAAIAELTLKGWTQLQIAQHLELDQSTVSRDLRAIQEQWKANALRDFDADKTAELENLKQLKREYWAAWERSQADREISSLEKLATGCGAEHQALGRVKVSNRTEQRNGDPAFLNGLVKIVELESKLLGLFPTEKTAGNSAIALTDTQLGTLADLMRNIP
ncbi:MAG: hypothetical protein KME35_16100 [Aphanocapsa sp. GSE-SYN-MK-11-07L]|jgi:transcriptional regulator with XRE-family HTH domain|nr:hypothetical protein [Aphanocapsa sp. GSE-SYN-MK-11-07L]